MYLILVGTEHHLEGSGNTRSGPLSTVHNILSEPQKYTKLLGFSNKLEIQSIFIKMFVKV